MRRSTVVVICDHAHTSGGLARVAIAGACGLARRGHRVIFVAAVGPVEDELIAAGVTVVCLGQSDLLNGRNRLETAARGIWNATAAKYLRSVIDACPPEDTVLHIHGWAKALSPSVAWICRRSGLPVFFTLHDYFALCPNGAFFDFQKGRNCELKALSPACLRTHCDARAYHHKLWRAARFAVAASTRSLIDGMTLITLSEKQRAVIAPHIPAGTALAHVPNPIDVRDLGPAPVERNREVLFVGRLSREKGPVLLAEAARKAGVPVRFIGDGGERSAIVEAFPGASLAGWLPAEQVTAEIRKARVVVLPSHWYETFGLAVHEALANGVPVIVSDNTAAVEAVAPGRNGFVFRSGDSDDLAARLKDLADDETALRMGREAYERYWKAPFTLDRHLDRLEEVYGAAGWAAKACPPAVHAVGARA